MLRLLVGVAAVALLLVVGHMALTTGMRMEGAVGRFAAGTCAACH
ncbi:hypothetical protein [Falsiroseomonas oryzae]|nr:hypothetical protein [Roseomonas sp. MO-31]